MGPSLKSGLYNQWDFLEESDFPLWEWLFGGSFWVGDGSSSPCPLSVPGSTLDLCRLCPCCHSLWWVHACISLVVSRGPLFLMIPILFPLESIHLSNVWFSEPWRSRFDEGIPFRTDCNKISLSAHYPAMGLCFCSHLLQENASLIMAETLIYEYSTILLGVILLLYSFNRTIVFDFLPKGRGGLSSLKSWPQEQCQRFPLMEWVLYPTRQWLFP